MLLAQLVVEYAADVTKLTTGVTAAADAMTTVGAAAEETNAYLAALGDQAFTTGVGFNGLTDSVAELDASLATLDASSAEAIAGIGGVEAELTSVAAMSSEAVVGIGGVEAELATVAVTSDAAAFSLANFAASGATLSALGDAIAASWGAAKLALAATGITLGLIAGVSVYAAGNFEQSMTQLVTGAGEAQSNIKMVSDGILNMAPAVGSSTKDLAAGMYLIESAGQHGAQALDTLKKSAEGAKVGAASLSDVANGVTTEMTDYASSGLTASQATNTLIATVSMGKTHMGELSQAMATILPTASSVGISLTDVSGAMATMTSEGVPAADAATYLRQTIMNIENPAKKAKDEMKAMGLNSITVAEEMKKSLPDALQMITDAAAKKFPVGSVQYNDAVATMAGGTKSLQGMLDLTGTHLDTFKGNVTGIANAVKTGGDSVTGWSKVQGDFNQKMDQAKSSLETVGISIGQKLLPKLEPLITSISSPQFKQFATTVGTDIVNGISFLIDKISTLVTWGTQLVSFFQNNQVAMDLLIGTLAAVAILIGGPLVLAFIGWAAAALLAGINTMIAMAPIILIGILIALVVAGIILAIQHWGDISKWLTGVWHNVQVWFAGFWADIVKIFGGIGKWFQDRWTEAYNGVTTAFGNIGAWFQGIWNDIVTAFKNGINTAIDLVNGFIGGVNAINVAGFHVSIPLIPHLASGTPNFAGGLALVGEMGPELVNLPRGAQVLNAHSTAGLLNSISNIKPASVASAAKGGNQTIVIEDHTQNHFYIDGKEVTNTVMKRAVKDLRGHGLKK